MSYYYLFFRKVNLKTCYFNDLLYYNFSCLRNYINLYCYPSDQFLLIVVIEILYCHQKFTIIGSIIFLQIYRLKLNKN